jgi:hypothetical protein
MKIEKVIFTIDDNPHYKGFWSSISKHYKQKFRITPKLFIIGNNVDITTYDTDNGEIEVVKPLEGIPTIIQALIGKFYFTKTEPDTTWMIGDLDLYPLQYYHFIENIKHIANDSYIHLCPHAYGKNWRDKPEGLAGYFHVAKGKIFEEELLMNDFYTVCLGIYKANKYGIKFYGISAPNESKQATNEWGWFGCEEMYTGNLLRKSKIIELPPPEYNRIDRNNMFISTTHRPIRKSKRAKNTIVISDINYKIEDIKLGKYIDFHAPRPYENYKLIIEKIVSAVGEI